MKKMSRAFQLGPYQHPLTLVKVGKTGEEKTWFPLPRPLTPNEQNAKEVFVRGKGYLPCGKARETIQPLATLTAAASADVYKTYGYNVCLGLVNGWGQSLAHDGSYGLNEAKAEVYNMVQYGAAYDRFTDRVQEVGDNFVAELIKGGFTVPEGGNALWYRDHFFGTLDRTPIHPLMYVEHTFRGVAYCKPSFNSMEFEGIVNKLIMTKLGNEDGFAIINAIVSAKDKIAYLTSKPVAEAFEDIFIAQKMLSHG
jgi:hypothetical protein